MSALSPHQFFHGTRAPLAVGAHLLPTGKTGVAANHGISSKKSVYMHTDEHEAWEWSHVAYGGASEGKPLARPWVGRVQPQGLHATYRMGGEHTAPSAQVLDRRDIMPGRQGTFPSINWNQFAEHVEVNHPDDADILGGHDAFARKYRPGLFEPPAPDLDSPERRFEHDPEDPDPGQRTLF